MPPVDAGCDLAAALSDGDVAIIGMACLFPGAPDLDSYWHNIVAGTDAITDPPNGAWDPATYYDPDSHANDRTYCKRGGYIGELAKFQPLDFGIMPATVDGGEPDQWLALQVARAAMADAGYRDSPGEHARTEVILGKGTYINRGNMTVGYHGLIIEQVLQVLRNLHPEYSAADITAIKQELKAGLPPFSADTAPALIGNIIAGRIANRLDLMGPAFTIDAACASALLAVEMGMQDLRAQKCDLALVGGVNVNTPLPTFILFCQLGALSRREQIRPFDTHADGTILGEGLGMVVLKRLADAERDRHRIYAVIKGVGSASDGRALHVMAPRVEGEVAALQRAYAMAQVEPASVGLIEAHGTATPVGDAVEIEALRRVFGTRRGALARCAVGSVKSMIGHTMPAAGMAGLIKAALALYHKVLPPSLHCDEPHPALGLQNTPFYINTQVRPWIHGGDAPRRAGVNAFGFGGINGHVVLEEYPGDEQASRSRLLHWDSEACILEADSRQDLVAKAGRLAGYLDGAGDIFLKDLAYTLVSQLAAKPWRLAIVAESVPDLRQKLQHALRRLADPACRQIKDNKGIYFFADPLRRHGKLAFMFPGEGAQYENMLLDLCLHFPEVRTCFDLADRAFVDHPRNYVPSDYIFPRAVVSETERDATAKPLWQIDGAVEAVLIANRAMWSLLERLEIRPDAIVGHSTGDYSAMFASGVIAFDQESDYVRTILSWNETHGRLANEIPVMEAALLAVATDAPTVRSIVEGIGGDLHIAMENCPHQNVMVGSRAAVEQAVEELRRRGLIYEFLPFDRPYHTPLFEAYGERASREFLSRHPLAAPQIDVYSCTSASRYPTSPAEISELFVAHWVQPVLFQQTIERMYADGVRIFVEVGPRGNLTAFVDDILRQSAHLAMPANVARRSGITQLNHLVGVLAAQGIGMNLAHLYARRDPHMLPWEESGPATVAKPGIPPRQLSLGTPDLRVAPRRHQDVPRAPAMAAGPPLARPEPERERDAPAGAPVKRPVALPLRAGAAQAVAMQEYLQGMDSFLELQHDVMQAFFVNRRRAQGHHDEHTPSDAARRSRSLVGQVLSYTANQELVSLRRLDPDRDVFLRDHALGGQVSLTDPSLRPVMVVPLTIGMEMLAQAASLLMRDKILIGMRDIQAHQWIRADEPVTLRISARRVAGTSDTVEVQLRKLEHETADDEQRNTPVLLRGAMVFADRYPAPPPATPFALKAERRSRLAPGNLYGEGLMFHGPCFQAVAAVTSSGQNGLVGQLEVLSPESLFQPAADPHFITDPVVLDAAGQLVGFWAAEYLAQGFVVFPYYLKSLDIYRARQPVGTRVVCRLQVEMAGEEGLRSDLDIADAEGNPWMRLAGWEDRRFDLPQRFHRFWVSPATALLSTRWRLPIAAFTDPADVECCRLDPLFDVGNALWIDLWASLVLTHAERQEFKRLKGPPKRRQEWLAGRTAAKDAVRTFLKTQHHLDLCPADIEIGQDDYGRPIPRGAWVERLPAVPLLSLSHSDGAAVAIAADQRSSQYLGIDLEAVRDLPASFVAAAFVADEQRLLAAIPESVRREWILRLWCAKEAVAKALGRGLVDGPHGVAVQTFDLQTGNVTVALRGQLAAAFTTFNDAFLLACTERDGDFVVACSLGERATS